MPDFWYPTAFSWWVEDEYMAIQRVVKSGQFTMGAEVEAFESEFAAWHGMRHGIMVNSGSSANLVAVAALVEAGVIARGDALAVPAIAWSTTYAPLIQYGLQLHVHDVDETWNTRKAVIACSILGNPVEPLHAPYLEDNCESLGAEIGGLKCGTRGALNTFSFFHSHQISAIEGGMILTNDGYLANLCRVFRAHGWTRDVFKPDSFANEYNFVKFGYNVRPLEMHAAIARAQLKKLGMFVAARRRNWRVFADAVDGVVLPVMHEGAAPFGLHFTVYDERQRDELVKALRADGIDCRLPTGGSFRLHEYGKPWRHEKTPNADRIHRTGLFLGNAPFAIDDKIEAACKIIKAICA